MEYILVHVWKVLFNGIQRNHRDNKCFNHLFISHICSVKHVPNCGCIVVPQMLPYIFSTYPPTAIVGV